MADCKRNEFTVLDLREALELELALEDRLMKCHNAMAELTDHIAAATTRTENDETNDYKAYLHEWKARFDTTLALYSRIQTQNSTRVLRQADGH